MNPVIFVLTAVLWLGSFGSALGLPLLVAQDGAPAASAVAGESLPLEAPERNAIDAALRARDYPAVESVLLRAATAHPRDARFYCSLGRVFFMDRQYLNAAIAFKKGEALQPLAENDLFTLAMAYVVMGRLDWARPELAVLVQRDPRKPIYVYWQGRLDYDRQDLFAAADKFAKVIALEPGFFRAYDNLGLCLEGSGKFDEALEQYRKAVRLSREQSGRSAWPALDLGSLLLTMDRLPEARAALEEAVALQADFEPAHLQLGMLLEKQNDHAAALAELQKAAALDPADAQTHFMIARVYKHTGAWQQANQELDIFKRLQQTPHIRAGLARP